MNGRSLRWPLVAPLLMTVQSPVACNRATADFMISSPLMGRSHDQWDPASSQAMHNQAALKVVRTG